MNTTECRSCGRITSKPPDRWAPVLVRGDVRGHTCPACPKRGEPISRIVNGAGVRFRVRLTKGTSVIGQQVFDRARTFDSLSAAREYVVTRSAELHDGRKRAVRDRSTMTVDQLADDFLAHQSSRVRPVTAEAYTHALKPARRYLGSRRVDSLDIEVIEQFAAWLSREGGRNGRALGRRASTLSLAMVVRILDRAVQRHKIVSINVARGVTIERHDEIDSTDLERWTEQEWNAFLDHAEGDEHAVLWMLVANGMRREEVLGLDWSSVDFTKGTVSIRQTRVRVSKGTDARGWVIGNPKSKASRRVLKPDLLVPGSMNALRRLWLAQGRPETGLVALDPLGRPVEPSWVSRRFKALCVEAGVQVIKVHSTRHTVAFVLHSRGVSLSNAAKHLGHRADVHARIYLFSRDTDVHDALLQMVPVRTAAGS